MYIQEIFLLTELDKNGIIRVKLKKRHPLLSDPENIAEQILLKGFVNIAIMPLILIITFLDLLHKMFIFNI